MSKQFSVKIKGDAHAVITKAKVSAKKNNVLFTGDEREGQFSGMGVEGKYGIQGDDLTITIEKKPLLITWSLLESKLRDFFL